jgi:hypothetical protein
MMLRSFVPALAMIATLGALTASAAVAFRVGAVVAISGFIGMPPHLLLPALDFRCQILLTTNNER